MHGTLKASLRSSVTLLGRYRHCHLFLNRHSSRLFVEHTDTYQTIDDVHNKLGSMIGTTTVYAPNNIGARASPSNIKLPDKQADLPTRSMLESYDSVFIPLEKNKEMRDKYITFLGGVRVGRILEDLDLFSVWLALKHISIPGVPHGGPSPHKIVTGQVDRIDFELPGLKPDRDIRISGHASWVGRSSIEITMYVDQQWDGLDWRPVTKAMFVMVARNPMTNTSAVVNPLSCSNKVEQEIFEEGQKRFEIRKNERKTSLLTDPPTEAERLIIHDLFLQTVDPQLMNFKIVGKPPNKVWLEDTSLKNVIVCHPENRNRSDTIFGGFLMRHAFELGWANAYLFCKVRPTVVHIDDIWFRRPVELGSLLLMHSQVVYTDSPQIQVKVSAELVQPQNNLREKTNHFYFTFQAGDSVPGVIPKSYTEAMMYLDGRRHYVELRKSYNKL